MVPQSKISYFVKQKQNRNIVEEINFCEIILKLRFWQTSYFLNPFKILFQITLAKIKALRKLGIKTFTKVQFCSNMNRFKKKKLSKESCTFRIFANIYILAVFISSEFCVHIFLNKFVFVTKYLLNILYIYFLSESKAICQIINKRRLC